MPRVSTATEGFYCLVTTSLADNSALNLEVSGYDEQIVATIPLTVASGQAEVDVDQATALDWPVDARFTLVAPIPGRAAFRLRIKDPITGNVDFTQRVTTVAALELILPAQPFGLLEWLPTWTTDPDYVAGDKLDLVVNGQDAGPSVPTTDGQWPAVVDLVEGPNEIDLYKRTGGVWALFDTYEIVVELDGTTDPVDPGATSNVVSQSGDHNSQTVFFEFDVNRPARLRYYETASPGESRYTGAATSSQWGAPGNPHRQTMRDLAADTAYTFYIQTSADGVNWEDVGAAWTFTTDSVPVVVASDIGNLGVFGVGTGPQGEINLRNSRPERDTAIIFVPHHTYSTNKVSFANRHLRPHDLSSRAVTSPKDEYRIAYEAGLTAQQATLLFNTWSSYTWGNPRFRIILCKTDSAGRPDTSQELARVNTIFIPFERTHGMMIETLNKTVALNYGERYAIAFINQDPTVTSAQFKNNPEACRQWIEAGNVGGYFSNNGSLLGSTSGRIGPVRGPAFGNSDAYTCYRRPGNTAWGIQPGAEIAPHYAVLDVATNKWHGYNYLGWNVSNHQNARSIAGNKKARMTFTLPAGHDVTTDVLHILASYERTEVPNGTPLTVTIKKNGSTVGIVQVSPNLAVAANNRNTSETSSAKLRLYYQADHLPGNIRNAANTANQNLHLGPGNYELIFTAQTGGAWVLRASPSSVHAIYNGGHEESFLKGAVAEYSANGGSSWEGFPPGGTLNDNLWHLGFQFQAVGQSPRP